MEGKEQEEQSALYVVPIDYKHDLREEKSEQEQQIKEKLRL